VDRQLQNSDEPGPVILKHELALMEVRDRFG